MPGWQRTPAPYRLPWAKQQVGSEAATQALLSATYPHLGRQGQETSRRDFLLVHGVECTLLMQGLRVQFLVTVTNSGNKQKRDRLVYPGVGRSSAQHT